jgi:hypothetical protein
VNKSTRGILRNFKVGYLKKIKHGCNKATGGFFTEKRFGANLKSAR